MTVLQIVLALVVALFIVVGLYRYRIVHHKTSNKSHEDFSGVLYQVGKSVVAYQGASEAKENNKRTLVCMHGWLEDHRYFSDLYTSDDGELIFINSCDYHAPVKGQEILNASWQTKNPYPECTIEYDAAVLIQAVKNLASHDEILLHGHSRGGAVVTEAIKQAPELFANATVILEAAILPEAPVSKTHKLPKVVDFMVSKAILFVLPFVTHHLAKKGMAYGQIKKMGPVNDRKTHLIKNMFSSAKSASVLLRNVENMVQWPMQNKMSVLENVKRGYILVGARDAVLSRRLMLKSAHKSIGNMQVVQTKDSNHFISLEIPSQVKSLQFN